MGRCALLCQRRHDLGRNSPGYPMTVLSDYVSGTISLTNGSVDFTGTGTGWLLAGFKEGDTIIDITGATEFMGVIASIDANAAGKLTKTWEGPTLVNAPYRMRYQPDNARVSAQARNLIELLGSGTLQGLAALDGTGGDKLPYLTGPGTAAVTGLSAFMRTLLDDADQTTARATLDAQASLGFAPVNKAGDNVTGDLDVAGLLTGRVRLKQGGVYEPGALYSDPNWGLIINMLSTKSFALHAAGSEVFKIDPLIALWQTALASHPSSLYYAFHARAWGVYSVAAGILMSSGGVSSVQVLSTGRFRVNFSTPMPDLNYAAIATNDATEGGIYGQGVNGFNLWSGKIASDPGIVSFAVFR